MTLKNKIFSNEERKRVSDIIGKRKEQDKPYSDLEKELQQICSDKDVKDYLKNVGNISLGEIGPIGSHHSLDLFLSEKGYKISYDYPWRDTDYGTEWNTSIKIENATPSQVANFFRKGEYSFYSLKKEELIKRVKKFIFEKNKGMIE